MNRLGNYMTMVTNPTLAFVFPGQGSQKLGMLAALAEKQTAIADTFAEASDVLGYDLWALSQTGTQQALNMTEQAQPLLLTASVALWRIWQQHNGVSPALMAGHSLGEWSALVCAEVISFADAVKLVQLRGRFMQEAVPEHVGSMAAIIGLSRDVVMDSCTLARQGDVVSAVNFNSPEQIVIAGHTRAVERAIKVCTDRGAKKAIMLAVSAPFHSSLLEPAADRLAISMEHVNFSEPVISVIHNVNAQSERDPVKIKQRMIEQIFHPVLWNDCVRCLSESGIKQIVECGPGKVLSGLVRRIDRSISTSAIDTPDGLSAALLNSIPSSED